jgi:hypothetical protein
VVTRREANIEEAAEPFVQLARQVTGEEYSTREIVQLAVDFANHGHVGGPLLHAASSAGFSFTRTSPPGPRAVARLAPSPEGEAARERLRKDLAAAIGPAPPVEMIKRLQDSASHMALVPKFELIADDRRSKRLLQESWLFVPLSFGALPAYAVLLLLDEELELGKDLKRCKFQGCGLFFFSSVRSEGTGRPRERYCSKKHFLAARRGTSAERMRRSRERRGAAAKHK